MATYALVAGAWHGSWCWSEVVPLLEAGGHRVLTPDLLGMGSGEVTVVEEPLAAWADQIADILRAEPDPIILVGHSRAGLVISEVAERVPEKIGFLIYLCAFLLQDGQTLQDIAQQADNVTELTDAMMIVHDHGVSSVAEDKIKQLFYNETSDRLLQVARERVVPEPLSSFTTPIHVTDERFGTVPRAYIECLRDRAIPVATQRMMQGAMPCSITDQLDSDHSPFFSMPTELVDLFERVRRSM